MHSLNRSARIAVATAALTLGMTASVTAVAAAHSPAPHATSHAAKALKVTESDYHIALSAHSGPVGKYTLTIHNKANQKHGLVINGPGLHHHFVGFIKAHTTRTATVTLRKGTYDIYCPIQGHKMLGMNTHLTVK